MSHIKTFVIVLYVVIIGIGENTDIILSPFLLASLLMASPAWLSVVMLLWTISDGLVVSGKLSIVGFTVFLYYWFNNWLYWN